MTIPVCCLICATTIVVAACGAAPSGGKVEPTYDKQTGRLLRLTMDAAKDGKPDIFSYMNGPAFVRIEIDNDENGTIDRWEYYGTDQKLEKVGSSRAGDGRVDAWSFAGADGQVAKVEVSTKRDGRVNRTEHYERGQLVRAETDTDGDGRVDKWETYRDGVLASASFDMSGSGTPDRTLEYGRSK